MERRHAWTLIRKLAGLLEKRQRWGFVVILAILAFSAALSQVTPLAVGYLTDQVLQAETVDFGAVIPILLGILVVNVVNEVVKVARRLIVEDTATRVEKTARQKAAESLLMAPLSYFRQHMTGNIHGRLNRSLEGTVKLMKLVFMDFAPAVATGVAAIVMIFTQLPPLVAVSVILVIPIGTAIVLRQIATQRGIRVTLMEKKAEMDGTMVELLGDIETIRTLDSALEESGRIAARSEELRAKEMRHHKAMAKYDCLKFINEAVFSVLVIALSVLLAAPAYHLHRHHSHGLPLLHPADRPAAGAPSNSRRGVGVRGAGTGLFPDDGDSVDFSYEVPEDRPAPPLRDNGVTLSGLEFSYPRSRTGPSSTMST